MAFAKENYGNFQHLVEEDIRIQLWITKVGE